MIAPKEITVTIDGKKCTGTQGQTILEIARANDVYIPTLCYLKGLTPWGGCRLCIVEIQGSPKVVPSCATPASDGSVVTATNDRLHQLRRLTLELLFSERNHICPICPSNNGDCGLQHQGYVHNIDAVRYPYLFPALPVDLTGEYLGIDHNRCILCVRCVRTCDEVEGVHTLDVGNRGVKNQIVVDLNGTFGGSTSCTKCGACVTACPTGALFDKPAAFRGKLNQSEIRKTTCIECPVGCGLEVYVKDNRVVTVHGDDASPTSRGHLCVKGRYRTWTEDRQRISQPMVRQYGVLQPVSWQQALAAIQEARQRIPANRQGVLISSRLTNEAVAALKSHPTKAMLVAPYEAELLAAATPTANALDQLQDADAIIVLGAHPARDSGVVAARIRTTVRKQGAKLVLLQCPKSDLDGLADICANPVSLERKFWARVTEVLRDARRPALVFGGESMSSIGVNVLERLIKIFEGRKDGQAPVLIGLPRSVNGPAITAAGIECIEKLVPWLGLKALDYLHVVASDEADGGQRLLRERLVPQMLGQLGCLVVQAAYHSPLVDLAHVVLPAPIWSEKTGTITNFEGRTLSLQAVLPPAGQARQDRTILESVYA